MSLVFVAQESYPSSLRPLLGKSSGLISLAGTYLSKEPVLDPLRRFGNDDRLSGSGELLLAAATKAGSSS